ncbi:hypothetical protein LXL04_037372 [Taraxacum kok-saghyz]
MQDFWKLRISVVNHDPASTLENPIRKIDDINDSRSNLVNFNDGVDHPVPVPDKINVSDSTDALKSNNVLWNQLDSWASQYKADAEFWGIGSNPIFTVLQDSNGNIKKVDVNEDEILKRNLIEPSTYNLKESEHLKQVQDRISYAKVLAKEMEIGKTVLPPNTSVAKFVISDVKLGFRETIESEHVAREIEKESEKNNRGRSRKSRWCAQHEQATLLSISGDDKSYPAAVSASDSGFPAGIIVDSSLQLA